MANLHDASKQWANRPADERYWGLEDMLLAARALRSESREEDLTVDGLRAVEGEGGDIGIIAGKEGEFFSATNYAFDTLCQRASAPAHYMRRLPASLAVQCLNEGLQTLESESVALVRSNGSKELRALTSERYARIWYDDTIQSLANMTEGTGWRVPPGRPAVHDPRTRPATAEDVMRPGAHGLSINIGDPIAPAGCYLSDRDMFVFMVDESREVAPGLFRGFFLANSEVKARVYELTTFLLQSVCGNHICWGVEGVRRFAVKHLGERKSTRKEFEPSRTEIRALEGGKLFLNGYNNASAADEGAILKMAMEKELGTTDEAVLETVTDYVNKRKLLISPKRLEAAQEIAMHGKYGNPRTAFAMVSGLTEIARDLTYADERHALNMAAGKIIDIVR